MKILLICSAGTSTSLLVQKMEEYIKLENKKYIIKAMGSAEAKMHHEEYDIFLLAPQVSYMKDGIVKLVGNKPVDVIPMIMYGRLDAKGVIELTEKLHSK